MNNLTLLFIGFLLLITFGYLLANILLESNYFLEKVSLGYLLGMGIFTFLIFLLNWAGIAFTTANFTLLLLVLVLGMLILNRTKKDFWRKEKFPNLFLFKSQTIFIKIVTIITVVFVISSFIYNTYWPIADWDALTLYDFRGKVFAQTGFMDAALSIHRYYLGYPLLTSLSHTFVYLFGYNNPHFLYSLNYLAFILVFYYSLKRETSEKVAIIFSFALAASPEIYIHSTLAYTNLLYTIYYSLGLIYLYFWFKEKSLQDLFLSGIMIGMSAWTRSSEPFWIVPVVGVFILGVFRKNIWPSLSYILIFLILKLPWNIFLNSKYKGLSTGVSSLSQPISIDLVVTRLFEVVDYLFTNVIKKKLILYLIFAVSLFLIRKRNKNVLTFATMILSNLTIVFGGVFIYSFIYPKWVLIGDSVSRMSMVFTPLILFLVALVLGEKNLPHLWRKKNA